MLLYVTFFSTHSVIPFSIPSVKGVEHHGAKHFAPLRLYVSKISLLMVEKQENERHEREIDIDILR